MVSSIVFSSGVTKYIPPSPLGFRSTIPILKASCGSNNVFISFDWVICILIYNFGKIIGAKYGCFKTCNFRRGNDKIKSLRKIFDYRRLEFLYILEPGNWERSTWAIGKT